MCRNNPTTCGASREFGRVERDLNDVQLHRELALFGKSKIKIIYYNG
jgi:hypothetical protein